MKVPQKLNVNAWTVFLTSIVLAALVFFLLDFFSPNFNFDGLYLNFLPDHIFIAELFGLAITVIYAIKEKNIKARPWIISGVFTLIFVGFSFWNYYAQYSIPVTESNYRQDVSYTCIEGEMYSGTLNRTNLCVLRELPHEDSDFLVHLHIANFTNLSGFDSAEFMIFLLSQLIIFVGPLYYLVAERRNTHHSL